MPETQAEVIAGRYAAQLAAAGWTVTTERRAEPGVFGTGRQWPVPARVSCWVTGTRDPAQLITFGWSTVTEGGSRTTRYLGGSLSRPAARLRADRQMSLRTLTDLRQVIRLEQICHD